MSQTVIILAPSGEWIDADDDDPAPSSWLEQWSRPTDPASDYALAVAPPEVHVDRLIEWRRKAPGVDLLVVTSASDARVERFFGDTGVFFLPPPSTLSQLRSGIQEVLFFRRECRRLEEEGDPLPDLEESQPVAGWYELTGPSHPVFLRRFRCWIEALERVPLQPKERRRLIHAVREVGWNAIEWGNRFDLRRRLGLSFLALESKILFRIQNEGDDADWSGKLEKPPADPFALQQERAAAGLRPGGLGLVLVRRLVDRVEVSSRGDIVVMEKLLGTASAPAASSPAGGDIS